MKVLVLAGGYDQIALINELKKRNHYVILADYFENPPAKEYADKHYVISTLDLEKIYELAKKEEVDLITTACTDQALLTVAYVSEKLGLPTYIDYNTALNVTNKTYMKKILSENSIPTSKYYIVNDPNAILNLEIDFPVVIKPVDCNSSKGVKKIYTYEELKISLNDSMKISRSGSVVIEEFKEGVEISIDAFIKKGVADILSITETGKLKSNSNFTINKSEYPCIMAEKNIDIIKEVVQKIAVAFNLKNCPLLVQAIINNNDISVLEFSARMGGGTKYRLINEIAGIDIIKIYTDLVLGKEVDYKINKTSQSIKINYIYSENGIFDKIIGFEEAKKKNLIIDYFQYKTTGMEIIKVENSSDRVAGYLIKGTKEEINKKERKLKEILKVLDKDGKNIMKYDF